MLSALSEAEFCRKEAARLAAMSLRRASCRCLSGRSRDFSLVTALFCLTVFFGTGAGGCRKMETMVISPLPCLQLACVFSFLLPQKKITNLDSYLLFWAVNWSPVVVLYLLQLVKLHVDVVNGELKQVPEPSQVLRGGSRHGARVLGRKCRMQETLLIAFQLRSTRCPYQT